MAYVPSVDVDACLCHGECVWIAPKVFRLEDVAKVVGTGPDKDILAAAEACPAIAISVVDSDTGKEIFP